jgi:hypothetical protein
MLARLSAAPPRGRKRHGLAELGWRIAGGQASTLQAALVLGAWTLGSGLVALLAYRHRATGSAH